MKEHKLRIVLSLIAAMTIWSMSFIWSKMAFEVFTPVVTVFFRLIISSLLVFGYLLVSHKFQPIKKGDYKWFLLLGFFEPFLYFIGESYGLLLVPSTLASVIVSTIPLFTPLLGFFFYRERVSVMNVFGIVLSVFGVMIMVLDKNLSMNAPIVGVLLLGLAVVSAVFYALVLKRLSHHYSGYSIVAYQNVVGIALFLPLFLFFEMDGLLKSPIELRSVNAIVMLAVFASTIAFILYTYGIKHIGVTRSSAFVNLIPVLTAFFAWIFLKEEINVQKTVGIAVAISGLFVSQINSKKDDIDDVRPFEA